MKTLIITAHIEIQNVELLNEDEIDKLVKFEEGRLARVNIFYPLDIRANRTTYVVNSEVFEEESVQD